jgi:hypothetical protein
MAAGVPDLSVFERFRFERPPVGVKFSRPRPQGIAPLGRKIALCEALADAHKGEAFVYSADDELCAGSLPLGNEEIEPQFAAGDWGPPLGVFKEARANRRLYRDLPKLDKGTAKYVAFAPLDKLTFDPDVLVVTAAPGQAEVLLRASTFTRGGIYESRTTPVLGLRLALRVPVRQRQAQLHDDRPGLGHEGAPRAAGGAGARLDPLRPAGDDGRQPERHGVGAALHGRKRRLHRPLQ